MSEAQEPYEKVKLERDALMTITGASQQSCREAEMVVKLLVAAGHVSEELVDMARQLAKEKKP